MSDNIKVVVKVRPLIAREIEDKLSYQWRLNKNTLYQVDQNGRDCGSSFTFDKVYDMNTKTDVVYEDIAKPIVEAAVAGINGTICAYGQTTSGKTYTMTGTDDSPGIIPLAVLNLFHIIKSIPNRDFLVRVSYVEIYNETLKDLLDLTKPVKIQETVNGVKMCATEKLAISHDEVLGLMNEGKANRQTGSTNMNQESSRSHSIFQITIESRDHIEGEEDGGSVIVSQLNLVDLAGSERSGQTGATGIRFKEGTHINKSLFSLALVIKQLSADPNKHVNYRDSKLTRLLQNSLGGNAKTSIICAVTPAAVEETISTLQFANRAKAIKNAPAVNLVTTSASMIQSLTKQLSSLKTQLESKKHVEQDNYDLQKQISNLQKMILNGFGQNRSTDIISTAGRKLHHPRRVTISTLHPLQEDPVSHVPKICPPSLKYNPMSIGSLSELVPLQSASSLSSVQEQARPVTPHDASDEIIQIDSDDENTSDIQTCSPYHGCYKSKTPPCVLRKNAKETEKNLKEIIELTEREKLYLPDVVELLDKLDKKSLTIAKLEADIIELDRISKEKDQEMEKLTRKITEAEEEIKSLTSIKANLEKTCLDYGTKLTDWEVSLETLKKRSKSREDELLSLLKEQEDKKKNEVIENVSVIDNLIREKNNMIQVEKQLTLNLTEIQEQKSVLDKEIEVITYEMAKLKESNNKLTTEITERQKEIVSINKENDSKNTELIQRISKLEVKIKTKEGIIDSLKKEQNETRENIEKIKLGVTKVQNIITLLTGDINEIPEYVDDLVGAFNTLSNNLISLESIAKDTIKEKNDVITKLEQNEKEYKTMHIKIKDLSEIVDAFYIEYKTIILENLNIKIFKGEELVHDEINVCDQLFNKINNMLNMIRTTHKVLNQTISDKNLEINEFKINYECRTKEFNEESQKNNAQMQQICDLTSSRNLNLKNIFEKVTNLTSKFCIENNISCLFENVYENDYEQVILTIDKIDNYIALLKSERSICDVNLLEDAKNKILQLTEENFKLIQDVTNLETEKAILSDEMKAVREDSKLLTNELKDTNNLLKQLQIDLYTKTSEMECIENKAKILKDSFTELEVTMQDKINLLESENLKLTTKCSELEMLDIPKYYDNKENLASGDQDCYSRKRHYLQLKSPPSLLTICCNRIADAIDLNDDKSLTSSSSYTELSESKISTNKCNCEVLLANLQTIVEERNKLNITIERLQNENGDLLKEREDVHKEVQLLLKHSYELQKRVINHRTVLSTLTATTYAENKSLSSQVKFLQHHLSRFHHVCDKDIPTFKKQLYDLMTLLKLECLGKQNESFKRYSLLNTLDTSSLHTTFKNESTFDNDLLMLDTNVTLTTCDNTMTAHDQTYFDVTQVWVSNDVACQTNFSEVSNDSLYPQMKLESLDENQILEKLESLKTENNKLRDLVDNYSKNKQKVLVTTLSSPIKIPDSAQHSCKKCNQYLNDICISRSLHKTEIDAMLKKMLDLECEKNNISKKYRNLSLEVPSSEALMRKLSALEKELQIKLNENERLTVTLGKTNSKCNSLQEENHILSNEIMENISEIDVLKNEQDTLKESSAKLTEKCINLERELKSFESVKNPNTVCNDCIQKDEIICSLEKRISGSESHSKLNKSHSEADSSLRYNTICTLQNELHAGKEDCIELKEEVTTIKKHLEHSNLSISQNMDLDESIVDSHMYTFNKDYGSISENKFNFSNGPEKQVIDVYISDKKDCLNYYCEKTGTDKESFTDDFKILEVMKMLYVNFTTKHANEIKKLVNKLKDFEEAKNENDLPEQLNKIKEEQEAVLKDLKEKDSYLQKMCEIVSHIRNNISLMSKELESDNTLITFKNTFLKIVDKEFGFASSKIYESIIHQLNKNHNNVIEKKDAEIEQLKETTQRMDIELKSINEQLLSLKSKLNVRESEFELLQRQKEKIHEISNAVTIDIIKKEKEMEIQLTNYHRKLLKSNIINEDMDLSLPKNKSMDVLFDAILNKFENKESEKRKIVSELENLNTSLLQKDKDLKLSKDDFNRVIKDYETKLLTQISLHDDLKKNYIKKVEENDINNNKLTEEINILKENLSSKSALIKSLETKHTNELLERQSELLEAQKNLQNVQKELEGLKKINQNILIEKETCAIELEDAKEILYKNQLEINKYMTDIEKLKQSLQENSQVIESLELKSNTFMEENNLLQKQLQERYTNYARMENIIQTQEKTVSIQRDLINRLQIQKADLVKGNNEKDKQIEAIKIKCKSLEEECLKVTTEMQTAREEIEKCRNIKQTLEKTVVELKENMKTMNPNNSSNTKATLVNASVNTEEDWTNLHYSYVVDRMSYDAEVEKNKKLMRTIEELRFKNQDLKNTMTKMQKALDKKVSKESQELESTKSELSTCKKVLEELRERYKEVDEECETCAQYLREREEQCFRLKEEKEVLEKTVVELKENMKTLNPNNSSNTKATLVNASVNTEEDWTNLHSHVVDAEVEKNKKFMGTIKELRFKNQDLKNTMTKMQKALDEKVSKESQELESTKSELSTCKKELQELKKKYKEWDEKYETCAQYLREREEQCIRLKEEKEVLEVIESLELKSNTFMEENNLLQKQLQERYTNYARMENIIQTHEKTVSIQRDLINRLQIQKADLVKGNNEKDKQIEAIKIKCKSLEEECLKVTTEMQTAREEIEKCRNIKQTLELRISELESLDAKRRVSIDSIADTTRRRRQSIHDSKRIFADDVEDHKTIEAVLKGCSEKPTKTDDLLMDVDENSSNRSTPIRINRGRESLLSKHDNSDKDGEHSRPSSVAAARRRRRTVHDQRRNTENSYESSGSLDGEAAHFKRLLLICQEELEELRERYKEVDEECETCAQYLREREEQCFRLKEEKEVLEKTVVELKENMKTMNPNNSSNTKATLVNASVNTEEDWTNLHSYVVDAEVEKNKKLMRTIKELRFKNQDLKNTMTKMQKALDEKVSKESQELESTKSELSTCKKELEELKKKYKELDEECEICAEYLKERDEQCQKLKEIKSALEVKLEDYQQSSIVQCVRKKQQTLNDQNRRTPDGVDVATDTSDDLLSQYQMERDDSKLKLEEAKEIKRLKMVVDKLSQQKLLLEQQVSSVGTQDVAMGSAIVQSQQLSDVLKENQKLKKMNAKLITLYKKRGKTIIDSNIENEDPSKRNDNKD